MWYKCQGKSIPFVIIRMLDLSISLRIKDLREQKKLNQAKFASLLNTSQAAISRYEKGERSPDSAFLTHVANVFNVNITWLLTGEGEMFNNERAREAPSSRFIRLPVVGDIAAGFPTEVVPDEPSEFIEVSTTLLSLPPPYYVFRVDGESMLPVIHPGDYVVLSNGIVGFKNNHLNGKICAFRTPDGITLKQFVLDPRTRTTWLWPINSSFNPIPFTKDNPDLTLIGVLVLSIRKYT